MPSVPESEHHEPIGAALHCSGYSFGNADGEDDADEGEFDPDEDPDDEMDDEDGEVIDNDLSDTDEADDADADDEDLEADFPLGDGVADLSAQVHCPYCGEPVEIALDPGSGSHQEYVEDCQVCCQPWRVSVYYQEDGHAEVTVTPEDEQ